MPEALTWAHTWGGRAHSISPTGASVVAGPALVVLIMITGRTHLSNNHQGTVNKTDRSQALGGTWHAWATE